MLISSIPTGTVQVSIGEKPFADELGQQLFGSKRRGHVCALPHGSVSV